MRLYAHLAVCAQNRFMDVPVGLVEGQGQLEALIGSNINEMHSFLSKLLLI